MRRLSKLLKELLEQTYIRRGHDSDYLFSIFDYHLRVIHSVYWSGSLILMYLSREMAHRLRIEAVEHITSELPRPLCQY